MDITLIFPHQLFTPHPAIADDRKCCLVEDSLFFGDEEYPISFHQQKILLHRASMKSYADTLQQRGIDAEYFEYAEYKNLRQFFDSLAQQKISKLHIVDPTDYTLKKRLQKFSKEFEMEIVWYQNPNFLIPPSEFNDFFSGRKRYFMADFYAFQRKRLQILVDKNNKPVGGKWSFDAENRKKLPNDISVPTLPKFPENAFIREAQEYVQNHFPHSPGNIDHFLYPINSEQAEKWLDDFLQTRFSQFGPYEDAMSISEDFVFHSVLTPALNIGLISPYTVVERTLSFARTHDIPISSLEGFVRQIIGWREFMRAMYEMKGSQMRTTNFWNHRRKIPPSFWTGTTGIFPIDHVVKKSEKYAYAHHIERLMVLGNFMLLCEFDPDEIYRWFMTFFIDAYDWVMVPNVYAMSQYADGGIMTTKPYFSSSNYLRKMSNYPKGDWQEIWDGLFWRFIAKHSEFFSKNPRLSMMSRQLEKMDPDKKIRLLARAQEFLEQL